MFGLTSGPISNRASRTGWLMFEDLGARSTLSLSYRIVCDPASCECFNRLEGGDPNPFEGRENKCFPTELPAGGPTNPRSREVPALRGGGAPRAASFRRSKRQLFLRTRSPLPSKNHGSQDDRPLAARSAPLDETAADYGSSLLMRLGCAVGLTADVDEAVHPDIGWARSGAMSLTGSCESSPLLAPGPIASGMQGAGHALRQLAGEAWRGGDLDAAALLGERASHFGHLRAGDRSPGGSCRLLACVDQFIALNLARPEDRELLPAWLEHADSRFKVATRDEAFAWATPLIASKPQAELVERARLMGLPVAPSFEVDSSTGDWLTVHDGIEAPPLHKPTPLVLDLSTLWAGPLCGSLLGLSGARVIKCESEQRPDGARHGAGAFFDLLNHGKESIVLDLDSRSGVDRLEALLTRVDIVIESARPRALANLGIRGEDWIARRPGLTWVGITGYGRAEPEANWVAFGDDAAVASGLASAQGRVANPAAGTSARPIFCGDAIADPITGLHAALAALAFWRDGRSRLLDVSLCEATRHLWQFSAPRSDASVVPSPDRDEEEDAWWVVRKGRHVEVAPPRSRVAAGRAALLGADTERVLAELEIA